MKKISKVFFIKTGRVFEITFKVVDFWCTICKNMWKVVKWLRVKISSQFIPRSQKRTNYIYLSFLLLLPSHFFHTQFIWLQIQETHTSFLNVRRIGQLLWIKHTHLYQSFGFLHLNRATEHSINTPQKCVKPVQHSLQSFSSKKSRVSLQT